MMIGVIMLYTNCTDCSGMLVGVFANGRIRRHSSILLGGERFRARPANRDVSLPPAGFTPCPGSGKFTESEIVPVEIPPSASQRPPTAEPGPWTYVVAPAGMDNRGYIGKWMLFVGAESIGSVWPTIERETVAATLGVSAKRSNTPNGNGGYLVCVYTQDYRNKRDVLRVLSRLRELGFNSRLSYKEDNATYSGLYGSGAALYVAQSDSLSMSQRRDPMEPSSPPE